MAHLKSLLAMLGLPRREALRRSSAQQRPGSGPGIFMGARYPLEELEKPKSSTVPSIFYIRYIVYKNILCIIICLIVINVVNFIEMAGGHHGLLSGHHEIGGLDGGQRAFPGHQGGGGSLEAPQGAWLRDSSREE